MSESQMTESVGSQGASYACDNLTDFWGLPEAFDQPIVHERWSPPSCLELLGSPPFPKTGFPFIGFLATIYDHVADEMQGGQS